MTNWQKHRQIKTYLRIEHIFSISFPNVDSAKLQLILRVLKTNKHLFLGRNCLAFPSISLLCIYCKYLHKRNLVPSRRFLSAEIKNIPFIAGSAFNNMTVLYCHGKYKGSLVCKENLNKHRHNILVGCTCSFN